MTPAAAPRPGSLSAAVVQVGAMAGPAARWLADRRGWPVVEAARLDAAAASLAGMERGTILVVVGLDAEPPEAFLDFAATLAREAPALAAGLVYGRDEAQLLASAQRLADPPAAPLRAELPPAFAHPDFASYVAGTRVLRAERAESAPQLLTGGTDLLYLLGHSNGHDAGIGDVLICRRPEFEGSAALERAFPCYAGAPCRFAALGLPLVSTDAIRATVVVNLICWGVSQGRRHFAPETTVGEGLLAAGHIRTLVTSLRAPSMERADFLALYYHLGMGLPMGEVVSRVNRARLARGMGADLLCFGDPGVRFEPRVATRPARPAGGTWSVPLPPAAEVTELRIPLERGSSSGVAILEGGAEVSAAWLGEDAFFATVPPSPEARELAFSLCTLPELAGDAPSLRAMLQDVDTLSHFASALARDLSDAPRGALERLAAALVAAAQLLSSWRLAWVRPGTVLQRRDVDAAWESLGRVLDEVGDAALDAYREAIGRGPLYPMVAMKRQSARVAEEIFPLPCHVCGGQVRVERWNAPLTDRTRALGQCLGCGPLFDGDPQTASAVELQGTLAPGSTIRVRVLVRNPFAVRVPARATAHVRAFAPTDPPLQGQSGRTVLGPGAEEVLELALEIPADFKSGVHYLSAAVAVGTRVVFLHRPILISRGDM